MKAYGGQRPGGIGFGNQNGEGPQVDLLIDANEIANRGQDIRWAFADGTREVGSKRYALLTSSQACEAAMGRVGRSKQNNFRLSALRDQWVTWTEFCEKLKLFVIGI